MTSMFTYLFLTLFLGLSDTVESGVIGKLPSITVTNAGPVQGVKEIGFSGRPVNAYYGVPYAEPPVGQLRFAPPVKLPPWSDTLQADQKPCPCYQNIRPDFEKLLVSFKKMIERPWCEDCLKINLWVPETVGDGSKSVLVKFHPGKFQSGSSVHYFSDGGTTAVEEDIIVVTVNYRLNVFGFLRLPTAETPGNVGLLDQRLALEWVRDNVASFGGDPNSVTLFGLSAGATSVGLHLLSPISRGLFKRAAMFEHVPNDPWTVRKERDIVSKSLAHARAVNCTQNDYDSVVECLRNLTADELLAGFSVLPDQSVMFVPFPDGTFLPAKPSQILSSGRFNDADLLLGTLAAQSKPFVNVSHVDFTDITKALRIVMPHVSVKEAEVISAFYIDLNFTTEPSEVQAQIARMLNDINLICGANAFARRYSLSGNKVYRYIFDQPGLMGIGTENELYGGYPLVNQLPNTEALAVLDPNSGSDVRKHLEAQLSRKMMRYLGNFAKTGDPNVEDELEPKWPRHTASSRKHLVLGFNSSISTAYRARECAFISDIFPRLRGLEQMCHA